MGFGYDPVDSAAYAIPKSKNHMNIQKQPDPDTVDTPLEFGKFVFFSFIIILTMLLGLYIYRFGITTSTSQSTWGAFGDFLGGTLNPLVSFLTLVVAINVWRLQEEELAATRQALQESMNIAKKQTNLMDMQRIEQTMFSLIEQLRQSLKEFSVVNNSVIKGRMETVGLEAINLLNSALDLPHQVGSTVAEHFISVTTNYPVRNFDILALGIKELLSFITRHSVNDESRQIWFGMSVALLGKKTFELVSKWGQHHNDSVLMSCFNDMQTMQSKLPRKEN
jgi:hypothetical protein